MLKYTNPFIDTVRHKVLKSVPEKADDEWSRYTWRKDRITQFNHATLGKTADGP